MAQVLKVVMIYMEKTYSNYKEKNPDAPDSEIYAQIALRAPWEYKIDAIGNYLMNYNAFTSFPKKFGLMEKQIFVNSCISNGVDPEEAEFYGNMVEFCSENMVFETGFTIAGAGIKSASALKSGAAFSEGNIIAGSGAGNLYKFKKPTRQQLKQIEQLRNGETISVKTAEEARELLNLMPDLTPPPLGRMNPEFLDPKGTFRGDLINKNNPLGLVHDPAIVNKNPLHCQYPHYNIRFKDGQKAAILITGV